MPTLEQPSAGPERGPAPSPRESKRGRRALPWLFAAALLAFLFARLPRAELERAFAAGPYGRLAAFAAVMSVVQLLADVAATGAAFARAGVPRPARELLLARGATYLLGLLNSAAGQGGLGYYLVRTGAEPGRAFGAVLFLFATHLGAMAMVACAGMAAAGGMGDLGPWLPGLALLLGGLAGYLAVVRLRPGFLARRGWLAPLFEPGAGGFLAAAAARVPHVLALVAGLWGGLRLWGVALPAARGTVLLSAVLLVAALPLAPAGVGTTEAALVWLAAPYAPLPGAAARQSVVLAFCVLYHLFGIAAQAAIALGCMAALSRASRRPRAQAERSSSP